MRRHCSVKIMFNRLICAFVASSCTLYFLSFQLDSNKFVPNNAKIELLYKNIQTAVAESNKSQQVSSLYQKKKCNASVSNFVFVKTHKTASTTIFSLFYNYILRHKWHHKLVTPFPDPFVGGYPGKFRCDFRNSINGTMSLWHTRFDADEMRRCYPPETRYVTIIREPWAAFQSGYNYYAKTFENKPNCFGMPIVYVNRGQNLTVNEFLIKSSKLLNDSVPWYFRFRNYQSHDLGIDAMLTDKKDIQIQIQKLDNELDLVMVNEYMDESLVLLKDMMCMSLSEVRIPRGTKKLHTSEFPFRSDEEMNAFQTLNNIDIALYEHFNQTLWKRIDAYGRKKFAEDLQQIRGIFRMERETKGDEDKEHQKQQPENSVWSKWRAIKLYMEQNSGGCFIP